jgi:hypothetical protein
MRKLQRLRRVQPLRPVRLRLRGCTAANSVPTKPLRLHSQRTEAAAVTKGAVEEDCRNTTADSGFTKTFLRNSSALDVRRPPRRPRPSPGLSPRPTLCIRWQPEVHGTPTLSYEPRHSLPLCSLPQAQPHCSTLNAPKVSETAQRRPPITRPPPPPPAPTLVASSRPPYAGPHLLTQAEHPRPKSMRYFSSLIDSSLRLCPCLPCMTELGPCPDRLDQEFTRQQQGQCTPIAAASPWRCPLLCGCRGRSLPAACPRPRSAYPRPQLERSKTRSGRGRPAPGHTKLPPCRLMGHIRDSRRLDDGSLCKPVLLII